MAKSKCKPKKTSTHGGDLGDIVFGAFEAEDGSVSNHVWKQPGWTYRDYCAYIANMLQVLADMDDVPFEVVWDYLRTLAKRMVELRPDGKKKN